MSLPVFIINKTTPFVESFDRDLKINLQQSDAEASAKGLLGSGAQLQAYKRLFIEAFNALLNELKKIIFNDIKNKKLTKPEFSELRQDIQQIVDPLIIQFRSYFEGRVRQVISNVESVSSVLAGFDTALQSSLNKLFVNYEQEFDSIE